MGSRKPSELLADFLRILVDTPFTLIHLSLFLDKLPRFLQKDYRKKSIAELGHLLAFGRSLDHYLDDARRQNPGHRFGSWKPLDRAAQLQQQQQQQFAGRDRRERRDRRDPPPQGQNPKEEEFTSAPIIATTG